MNPTILLNRDHTISMTPNLQKHLVDDESSINSILIPIDDDSTSYICLFPNKYMKKFYKAKLSFEMVVVQHSYIVEIHNEGFSIMNKVNIEINFLEELFQYLHSLNRNSYSNVIANSGETMSFELIEYSFFRIEIFDKKSNMIYEHEMNLSNQMGQFGPKEILIQIQDLYDPQCFTKYFENIFISINLENNRWCECKTLKSKRDIIGIFLIGTKSITFIKVSDYLKLSSNIYSIYCYNMIFNPDITDIDNVENISVDVNNDMDYYLLTAHDIENHLSSGRKPSNIRFNDEWCHDLKNYVEYILYLKYMYSLFIASAEFNDNNEIKGTYKIVTKFHIDMITEDNERVSKILTSDNENIITLSDLMNIID